MLRQNDIGPDLSHLIGEELTIRLLQPDGSMRSWHELCSQSSWLGADGGVARYRLRLKPAFALLRLRRDNYIFQDKSVRDIITSPTPQWLSTRLASSKCQQRFRRNGGFLPATCEKLLMGLVAWFVRTTPRQKVRASKRAIAMAIGRLSYQNKNSSKPRVQSKA